MKSFNLISYILLLSLATALAANDQLNNNLLTAITAQHIGMARNLLAQGANVNYNGGAPLIEAIKTKNVPLVTLLLDEGAEINVWQRGYFGDYYTPLMKAAAVDSSELVSLLLEKGADWRAVVKGHCDDTFCDNRIAIQFAQSPEVKKLLEDAENNQVKKDAELVKAVKNGTIKKIHRIIKQGADVNHRDNGRSTPS